MTKASHPGFTPPGNAHLSLPADEVLLDEIHTPAVKNMIDLLYSVAERERQDTHNGFLVGLAAPQIGIMKRIILVDIEANGFFKKLGRLKAYINPKIISRSVEEVLGPEDCYSVDPRLCGAVRRALTIKIQALDILGAPLIEEYSGFPARIFQHEIDHLDGIRFPDRIGETDRLHWVENHEYLDYLQSWENWPTHCPTHFWKAMKEGQTDTR